MKTQEQEKRDYMGHETLFQDQRMLAELYVRSANNSTSKSVWAYMLLIVVCITAGMAIYNESFSFSERFLKMSEYVHNAEIRELLKTKRVQSAELSSSGVTEPYGLIVSDSAAKASSATAGAVSSGASPHFDTQTIHGRMLCSLVENFVESQYFTFPVIGIKIQTADVITILSVCLLLIFLWCYVCIRNENRVVGKILNRTYGYPLAIKQYILSGIGFKNVFFPISYRKRPYNHLRYPGSSTKEKLEEMQAKEARYESNMLDRQKYLAICLFIFPILISCFSIFGGILDLNAFSHTGSVLEKLYRIGGDFELYKAASNLLHYNRSIWIVLIISSAVLACMVYLCWSVVNCLTSTSRILFDYKNSIKCEVEFRAIKKEMQKWPNRSRKYDMVLHPVSESVEDLENTVYGFSVFTARAGKGCRMADIVEVEQIGQHLKVMMQNYDEQEDRELIDDLRNNLIGISHTLMKRVINNTIGEPKRKRTFWYCILLKFHKE